VLLRCKGGAIATLSTLSEREMSEISSGKKRKSMVHEDLEELLIGYIRAYTNESKRSYLMRKKQLNLESSFNRVLKKVNLSKDKTGRFEVSAADAVIRI
jgi:uncharacterized protein (DUF2252 family)